MCGAFKKEYTTDVAILRKIQEEAESALLLEKVKKTPKKL